MLGMKPMIYATEIIGILVMSFQMPIAQATGLPVTPWPVQAGAIVILGTLLLVQMTKVGPTEAKRRGEELDRMLNMHRDTSKEICSDIKLMTSEISGMRNDSDKHQAKWTQMFEERPCLGLDGMKKLEESIRNAK